MSSWTCTLCNADNTDADAVSCFACNHRRPRRRVQKTRCDDDLVDYQLQRQIAKAKRQSLADAPPPPKPAEQLVEITSEGVAVPVREWEIKGKRRAGHRKDSVDVESVEGLEEAQEEPIEHVEKPIAKTQTKTKGKEPAVQTGPLLPSDMIVTRTVSSTRTKIARPREDSAVNDQGADNRPCSTTLPPKKKPHTTSKPVTRKHQTIDVRRTTPM